MTLQNQIKRRVEISRSGIEFGLNVAADNGVQGVVGAWRPAVGQVILLDAEHAHALIRNGGGNYAPEVSA